MAVEKISRDGFEAFVQGEGPVLVDFFADWCGPCRMLAPVLETLDKEIPALKVGKVNVDECGELAMRFGISSIPFVALFRNGQMVASALGYMPAQALRDALGL